MLLRRVCCWLWTLSVLAAATNAVLVDKLSHAISNAVTCASCHALLGPLRVVATLGDKLFIKTITAVCIQRRLQDEDVCRGTITSEGPILAHVLRSIDVRGDAATKLCASLFGLCAQPPVRPYAVEFPKPPPVNLTLPTSSGKTPFRVLHISDSHVDRKYTPGAESACNKPICCRHYADQAGKPIVDPASPNGSRKCDAPVSVVDSFFAASRQFATGAQFTLFTGDIVSSAIWLVNEEENTQDIHAFNADLAAQIGMPVYGAVGNHEAAPVNSFPRNTTATSLSSQWIYDALAADWAPWIGPQAADQVLHCSGSYSVLVPGTNLRIISLNTIYWYIGNFWLFDSDNFQPDPNGILAFLIENLQAAEDAGQRVWIVGHLSPGRSDTLRDQSNYYDQIVQRYKNTIAASFFGHSHNDEFEIAYSDYMSRTAATATSVAFLGPALTPRNGNPELKVYDIDPDTYEVMDFTVFIANMSAPTFPQELVWSKYYSARETYGPTLGLLPSQALTAPVMHNITAALEADDGAFAAFHERLGRGLGSAEPCVDACKARTICQLRAMRSEDNCWEPTPGLQFKRDGASEHGHEEEHCEGSKVRSIFRAMVGREVTPSDLMDLGA